MAAIFVLPAKTAGHWGPVASYLSTAGWATAAEHELGESWIVSPEGIIDEREARRRATANYRTDGGKHRRYRHVPDVAKTMAKDVRDLAKARGFAIDPAGPWARRTIDFVWQRHDLFQTAGLDLADELGCPSVLFVPATVVWEAKRWGTDRPGWGGVLERLGERPALRRATVVACGSEVVARQAVRIGTPSERIVITPTGVDVDRFTVDEAAGAEVRAQLGLTDRFVVGWVGSFRPFHALQSAVEAVEGLEGVSMLFVGDGPERSTIEAMTAERGIHAVFTGTVDQADLVRHLAAMDVGLVLARRTDGFHYSPLKLAEYLAAGLATIAPDVPSVSTHLRHDQDLLLTPPLDTAALRAAIERLQHDPALKERLGRQGRRTAETELSWDRQVRRVLRATRAVATPDREDPAPTTDEVSP